MSELHASLTLAIKNFSEHSPVSAEEVNAINAIASKTRSFEPGAYVFREGLTNPEYAFVLSGYFYKQKVTTQGHRQILSVAIPGDALNPELRILNSPDVSVQCMSNATVAYISFKNLNECIDVFPNIGFALDMSMLAEVRRLREWLLNIGGRDGQSRIANFISEFALRTKIRGLSDGISFDMPLSQELIGNAVGMTAVHVNRILKRLVSDNLLQYKDRTYKILDLNRFQDVGEFTGNYISNGHND